MLVVPGNSITTVLLASWSIKAATTVERPSPITFQCQHTSDGDSPLGNEKLFWIDHIEDTSLLLPLRMQQVMQLLSARCEPEQK